VAEFRLAGDPAQFLFRNPEQERGAFLRNVSGYLVVHLCVRLAPKAVPWPLARRPEWFAFIDARSSANPCNALAQFALSGYCLEFLPLLKRRENAGASLGVLRLVI